MLRQIRQILKEKSDINTQTLLMHIYSHLTDGKKPRRLVNSQLSIMKNRYGSRTEELIAHNQTIDNLIESHQQPPNYPLINTQGLPPYTLTIDGIHALSGNPKKTLEHLPSLTHTQPWMDLWVRKKQSHLFSQKLTSDLLDPKHPHCLLIAKSMLKAQNVRSFMSPYIKPLISKN